MSDGPSKAPPQEAQPLDDIILGDDDATQTEARPVPVKSVPPPVQRASQAPQPPAGSGVSQPPTGFRPSSPPARFPSGSTPAQRMGTQPPAAQPDFLTSAPPVRSDRPSAPAPPGRERRSSGRMRAVSDRDSQGKKRAKMTLKIPDDEVVREPTATASNVPPPAFNAPPVLSPDDTVELPADELRARVAALSFDGPGKSQPPAPGVDPSQERGWTPFSPNVAEEDEDSMAKTSELPLPAVSRAAPPPPVEPTHAPITPMRIVDVSRLPAADGDETDGDEPTMPWRRTSLGEVERAGADPVVEVSGPPSEEIPVEMEIEVPEPGEDAVLNRLSISDEIKIDEAPLATSDEVLHFTERVASETGEVEVAPEDLVSVESLPPGSAAQAQQSAPPIKTAGKFPAFKEDGALASAPPTSGPQSRPQQQQPSSQAKAPLPPAQASGSQPAAVVPAPPVERPANVAARTPSSRRPSSPLFAPPVGALAPPPMTETAAMRKKTRPWWEELFNDDFIRTMAKVSDPQIKGEVTFIEESLGCEPGAMVLDLACGTGRHAVELAARGYQVVGFDLSLAMLARASDEAQDRKQKINFVQGDMREMTFEETFDGVYAWNTSFGFFDEQQNNTVIARVHKALKKGGQLLLDVVNRDFIIRQAPSLAWFEGDGCICMDEMTIDFITSRMKVKRTLMMDDGRTKEIEYSIRIYSLHELGKLLHENGFRVAEVSGRTGTPGVFFGAESPRTLILAEKR